MLIGKMRQHLVPGSGGVILFGLNELGPAQEACRTRWTSLPSEVGEYMSLEEAYIGE
jgi:hypothetical protein